MNMKTTEYAVRKETREKKTTFLLTRERSRWDGGSRGKEAAGKKAAPRFFFGVTGGVKCSHDGRGQMQPPRVGSLVMKEG